jgi:hypothetical protein
MTHSLSLLNWSMLAHDATHSTMLSGRITCGSSSRFQDDCTMRCFDRERLLGASYAVESLHDLFMKMGLDKTLFEVFGTFGRPGAIGSKRTRASPTVLSDRDF